MLRKDESAAIKEINNFQETRPVILHVINLLFAVAERMSSTSVLQQCHFIELVSRIVFYLFFQSVYIAGQGFLHKNSHELSFLTFSTHCLSRRGKHAHDAALNYRCCNLLTSSRIKDFLLKCKQNAKYWKYVLKIIKHNNKKDICSQKSVFTVV